MPIRTERATSKIILDQTPAKSADRKQANPLPSNKRHMPVTQNHVLCKSAARRGLRRTVTRAAAPTPHNPFAPRFMSSFLPSLFSGITPMSQNFRPCRARMQARVLLAIATSSLLMTACGGGSSSTGAQIEGTAARGAPLSHAAIEVLDSKGETVRTQADENGEYKVGVSGLQSPLLVTASAASGESVFVYRAISESPPATGGSVRVNVTPLTDAAVALASSDGGSPEEFADPTGAALAKLDRSKLRAAEASVKASIQAFAVEAGQPDFDPLKSAFKADSKSPGDKILDSIRTSMDSGKMRIEAVPGLESNTASSHSIAAAAKRLVMHTSAAEQVHAYSSDAINEANAPLVQNASATTTSSTQTIAGIWTWVQLPAVTPILVLGPWDSLPFPKPYELTPLFKTWVARANTCLALAPDRRVTLDGNNKVTGLAKECRPLVSASGPSIFNELYLHDGYSLHELWGARLRYQIPKGARVDLPQIIGFYYDSGIGSGSGLALIPAIQGAQGAQQMVVRLAYNSPQGSGSFFETARRTGNTSWQIFGNRQQYDAGVTAMIARAEDVSTNGYVPTSGPDAGKNVGFFDTYTSRLALRFNPAGPNAERVYAVRVKGPGLPLAGVVLARSSASGTGDFLTFLNNNGTLPGTIPTGTPPMLSNLTANTFTLAVASMSSTKPRYSGQDFFNDYRGRNSDGSPSTSPSIRVAYPQVDVKTIPLFAEYVFEVFNTPQTMSLAPSGPDRVFTHRLLTRPLDPALGAKQPWATLSSSSRLYLKPTGSFAMEQSSAVVGWSVGKTAPPVQTAYLEATGPDSDNLFQRTVMNATATTSGTTLRLSGEGQKNGNGQIAAYNKAPAFSATTGMREVGVRQTKADGLRLRSSVFHNGRAY